MKDSGVPMKPDVPDDANYRGVERAMSRLNHVLYGVESPICEALLRVTGVSECQPYRWRAVCHVSRAKGQFRIKWSECSSS
jgi:hypothetical protein